ncbi:hypothetical protein PRIPAC_84601, partial [Pristionchus pacificus]
LFIRSPVYHEGTLALPSSLRFSGPTQQLRIRCGQQWQSIGYDDDERLQLLPPQSGDGLLGGRLLPGQAQPWRCGYDRQDGSSGLQDCGGWRARYRDEAQALSWRPRRGERARHGLRQERYETGDAWREAETNQVVK